MVGWEAPDKKQFVLACAGARKLVADEKACSRVILKKFVSLKMVWLLK